MQSVLSLALVGAGLVARAFADSSSTQALALSQLAEIKSRTENLTNAIEMFDQSGTDGIVAVLEYATNNIHYPAAAIVDYVLSATEALSKVPTTLDLTQTFVIGGPTQQLAYSVNHSIAALNAKQPIFNKFAVGSVVENDLKNLTTATNEFSKVLIGYIPTNVRPVAYALQDQIVESLQMGLDCIYSNSTTPPPSCNTAMINSTETFALALKYGAIRPDGYPIA